MLSGTSRRAFSLYRLARVAVATAAVAAVTGSAFPDESNAGSKTHGKVIAGWVEKVTLHPWGHTVKAKLDTGAATSSIHAENIERFKRNGKNWVRFDLTLKTKADGPVAVRELERPLLRRVLVRQAEGDEDHRLVVGLDVCVNGRLHDIEFTLADRTDLIYSILLGRKFLAENLVVDASETFLTKASCDDPKATDADRSR